MKKILSLLIAIVVGLWSLTAQNTILNSDFELWPMESP